MQQLAAAMAARENGGQQQLVYRSVTAPAWGSTHEYSTNASDLVLPHTGTFSAGLAVVPGQNGDTRPANTAYAPRIHA